MKDLKYIIKRIIIGVAIALLFYAIKGSFALSVYAKDISSAWMPFSNHIATVSNLDETVTFSSPGGSWVNWGFGYLRFNFSIIKVSGSSIAPLVVPNGVGANNFVCNISSTSVENSTFTGSTYSATCPMTMGSNGLTSLYIGLSGNQQNEQGTYRITLGGLFTFEKVDDISLDTSSTDSAINNQITNDNSNTQQIINSQNDTKNEIKETNKSVKEVKDSITSNNVDSATNQGSSFFNDFQSNDHGLSGIITAPLRLIQSISDSECSPLSFPLPFVDENVILPCMSSIYETHFSSFLSIYRIITTGLIGYWVVIRIFSIVKGFQDPNSSKVEVLEL